MSAPTVSAPFFVEKPDWRSLQAMLEAACAGVEVRLRAIGGENVADYRAEIASAEHAAGQGKEGDAKSLAEDAARARQYRTIVAKLVTGVHLEVEEGAIEWRAASDEDAMPPTLVQMLDEAGYLYILFTVANHYQGLGPLQRRAFGVARSVNA